jgi:hypothetical protein
MRWRAACLGKNYRGCGLHLHPAGFHAFTAISPSESSFTRAYDSC